MGSYERLLLMMYTEIPPLRSDFYQTKIYRTESCSWDGNYIVLGNQSVLVLQKYKTAKVYKTLRIDLPPILVFEIEASLAKNPRNYLFVSTRTKTPYTRPNSYNRWANRVLKKLFGNENISLSMLRHIYVSRRDLKLEDKSGLEQDKMGHSLMQ